MSKQRQEHKNNMKSFTSWLAAQQWMFTNACGDCSFRAPSPYVKAIPVFRTYMYLADSRSFEVSTN